MNADGSGSTQLTPDGDCNWAPNWSHDDSKLFFASTRDGSFDIYTIRPDGTDPRRVTSHDGGE